MTESLQSILALLDEGLWLYRRNFAGFVLITASWFVPVAIAVGLAVVAESWVSDGYSVLTRLLFVFGGMLVLFPLLIYLIGGLSRAAAAAAEGQPVRFRQAMAIHPLRATGMGCFTVIYTIAAQVVSWMIGMACVCPLYIFGFMALAFIGAASSAGSTAALGLVAIGIMLAGMYIFMTLVGATGSGLFYCLQPWVQESRPFGESLQRSVELSVYRFGHNLLIWFVAAMLTAAVGLTVMVTIGLVLSLPLFYVLGEDSSIAQAVGSGAWLIGFMLVLPPLPIWMALLYRRNRALHEGAALQTKVEEWERSAARIQQPEWSNGTQSVLQ